MTRIRMAFSGYFFVFIIIDKVNILFYRLFVMLRCLYMITSTLDNFPSRIV